MQLSHSVNTLNSWQQTCILCVQCQLAYSFSSTFLYCLLNSKALEPFLSYVLTPPVPPALPCFLSSPGPGP